MSEKIGQLKLKSYDGKYYNTDVVDIEGMFRIIVVKQNKLAYEYEDQILENE